MQQRRLITATAAIAMAVSGWAASAHAQALSGDPNQNHKAGVPIGGEVNGAAGIRSGDNTNANGTSTANNGATAAQAVSPQTPLAAADSDGIRRTLSEVTEAALKPDGIGQISQFIATEDSNRLRDLGERNSILEQQVQKFQQNWKQKYNQDFAIKDQQLVLNDRNVQIVPGAIVSAGGAGAASNSAGGVATGGGASNQTNANTNTANAQNPTAPGSVNSNATAENSPGNSPNGTAPTGVNQNPTAANSQTPNPNPTAAGNNAPTVAGEATPASARQSGGGALGTGANGATGTGTTGAGATGAGATGAGATGAGAAGASATGTGATGTGATGTAANGANNNVATVIVPASHNMPEASVVLTREATASATGAASATADTWKLDIPNSTDTRQLQQNLARQLRTLNDAKGTWPASANDATNMVTHAVVLAISQPGQYPPDNRPRNLNNNTNTNRTNATQQPNGAARSNVGGGTGSTGAATGVGGTGSGTTGAGSTGSRSTGAGPTDNNTTGAGSTGSGGQNP